ncbi:hypothetical protein V8F33_014018 [Rhypophila sp. PSN 637]
MYLSCRAAYPGSKIPFKETTLTVQLDGDVLVLQPSYQMSMGYQDSYWHAHCSHLEKFHVVFLAIIAQLDLLRGSFTGQPGYQGCKTCPRALTKWEWGYVMPNSDRWLPERLRPRATGRVSGEHVEEQVPEEFFHVRGSGLVSGVNGDPARYRLDTDTGPSSTLGCSSHRLTEGPRSFWSIVVTIKTASNQQHKDQLMMGRARFALHIHTQEPGSSGPAIGSTVAEAAACSGKPDKTDPQRWDPTCCDLVSSCITPKTSLAESSEPSS